MNSKMTQRVSRASLDDDFRCRRAFPLERLNTGSAVCNSYNSNRNQCRTEQLCCAVKNSTTLRCACAGMRTYILPISLILSFVVATNTVSATVEAGAAAEDSGESCATLGFPSVSCPTCETIKDIVADQGMTLPVRVYDTQIAQRCCVAVIKFSTSLTKKNRSAIRNPSTSINKLRFGGRCSRCCRGGCYCLMNTPDSVPRSRPTQAHEYSDNHF